MAPANKCTASIPHKEHREQGKIASNPALHQYLTNKLQPVVKGGNNQAAEPCPEDSDVASSAPKDAIDYTLDAEAVSKGASFCATAGTKNNKAQQTTFIPPQKGAPHESLELGACKLPCISSHKCQDTLVDAQARLNVLVLGASFWDCVRLNSSKGGARFSALQRHAYKQSLLAVAVGVNLTARAQI